MKNTNPVKFLWAFALVLLVLNMTDGRIMSKCELKAKLDAAQFQQITVMGEKIPVNNLIARLVCMANSTAFDTSFIKAITVNNEQKISAQAPSKAPQRPQVHDVSKAPTHAPLSKAPPHEASKAPPHVPSSKAPPHNESNGSPHNESKAPSHEASKAPPLASPSKSPSHEASKAPPHKASKAPPRTPPSRVPPQVPSSRAPPKNNQEGPTKAAQSFRNETQHPQPTIASRAMENLYGVFQLSDQLACDSGLVPSRNLCKISCNALIDDDITNDIACLKTLMNSNAEKLLVKECRSVVPDKLFANCA